MLNEKFSEFRPQPHPYKGIFQEHNISQALVSRYLGVSVGHVNHMLNGYQAINDTLQKKLDEFVKIIEAG